MQPIRYTLSYYLALIDNAEDQNKFEYLYNHYQKQMYYTAKKILNDAFIAEDAVHEAFVKIARNMNKIDDETSDRTKAFVMIVTENAAKDVYRKRKQYFEKEIYEKINEDGETTSIIDECIPALEIPDSDFQGSDLGKAIGKLSDDARQVVLLYHGMGYEVSEIAEITDFTVAKVRKLLTRSKHTLKELLDAMKEEPADER